MSNRGGRYLFIVFTVLLLNIDGFVSIILGTSNSQHLARTLTALLGLWKVGLDALEEGLLCYYHIPAICDLFKICGQPLEM